jgi:hypothetical protein
MSPLHGVDAHFGFVPPPYRHGFFSASMISIGSKAWLKIKNPKAPAAARALDGTF